MTEILICVKFYKQMHLGTNKFIMNADSKRSPILTAHTLHIHVKESNNSLLKIVMLCLVSLYLLDGIINSAPSSLNKLTWRFSSATHPVCSYIIAATL